MSPGTKSSTAIVVGQIASALIGFALGVVVTLLAVVDWAPAPPRPATAVATPVPAAAPAPAIPAPTPAAPPPAAGPVAPPETHAAAATPTPAAPPPEPVPAPVAVPLPPPPPPEQPAVATASPPAAVEPPVPVPAAKPPTPPGPSPARTRFVVQVGAFVNDEIAAKVATRLTAHDHPAEVLVRTDDSGRAWNVVRLTEVFASRGEAERVANTLKRDRDVDTLIIRLPPAKSDDAAKDDAAKKPDKPGATEAPPP